jgi:3-oxoacyl-[acyl-carrier protein] reductase
MSSPRTALITGASGAIGGAVVDQLLENGWEVLAGYRTRRSDLPSDATPFEIDLESTTTDTLQSRLESTQHTPFNLVVHAAGNTRNHSILSMSAEDWQSVRRVHLDGGYRLARSVRPLLETDAEGVPQFITIVSLVGIRGGYGQGNYAAAKAGLIGLVMSLAREWAPDVNVNAIRPPLTRSAMTDELSEQALETSMEPVLTERMADPETTARQVRYLAEEPDVTGQIISPDHRVHGPWQ